ncbi:MAG TPA: hypothetical protein PKO36_17985, partial [Candidatus Hydrogenedentes bacterium]|nr:hypothetical protein [Candidatus Hydrogenedentota bacterium]
AWAVVMANKKKLRALDSAEKERRRENALRPNPYLGYNHNALALYLLEREAYAIAEAELRRAVWLNPHEPVFMANLAWCLFKQGRDEEAWKCLRQAVGKNSHNPRIDQIAAWMGLSGGRIKEGSDAPQE